MSYLLRLQHYLRSPEAIDPAGAWVALEEGEAPPLLARGEQLCSDILRSPSIAPIDMLEYAARLLLLEPGALPQLGRLFATSQAFGHGPTHQQARKALATRCRAIERDMASWLPAFTTTLFAQMRALGPLDAGTLARTFVNSAMQEMMAHDLGIDAGQLPALSETFFSLRPTRHRLETLDREVGCLLEALEAALVERNRPTDEAALLASLQVIGNEPLEASLVHGMLRETTAEGALYRSGSGEPPGPLCTRRCVLWRSGAAQGADGLREPTPCSRRCAAGRQRSRNPFTVLWQRGACLPGPDTFHASCARLLRRTFT